MKRFALLCLVCTSVFADADLDAFFAKDVLVIQASELACYRFDIYLAQNDEQRQRGLMHVRELPDTSGMLFVYDRVGFISMWMKNTFISLDMVFAHRDGRVSSIVRATEPQSLRSVSSKEAVSLVLELKAGTADRLGLDEDARLLWDPPQTAP